MKSPTPGFALMLTLAGIVACSTADPSPEANQPAAASTRSDDSTNDKESDMPGQRQTEPGIEEVISAARKDLAARRSVSDDEIELVTAQRVTWSDGSIGCPEPGMMYTQALVPGYFVHLRADGKDAYYHTGQDGRPMHCPAERSRAPVDRGNLS